MAECHLLIFPHLWATITAVSNDANGYSGHSIKDRMIAKLEELFDNSHSNHEKQILQVYLSISK